MRLPKWLDRERRIRALTIVSKVKADAAEMWFRRYQAVSKSAYLAGVERDRALDEVVVLKRQNASTQARLAEALRDNAGLRDDIAKYEQGAIPS